MSIALGCAVKDCVYPLKTSPKTGRPYLNKGYCVTHYGRIRSGRPLNHLSRRDARKAIIEGSIAKIPLGVGAKDGYVIVDVVNSYLNQ